jgi:hypothetical protein
MTLTYSLLLSFFVLLTPRELWHDCEQHSNHIHHHSGTVLKEKDCFACDFDLGIIDQVHFFEIHVKGGFVIPDDTFIRNGELTSFFNFFKHRGPPTI